MGILIDRVARSRRYFAAFALCLLVFGATPAYSFDTQADVKAGGPSVEVVSALGRKLYALPDDENVTTARRRLAADPKNVALVLALSKAEAGRRQYERQSRRVLKDCHRAQRC